MMEKCQKFGKSVYLNVGSMSLRETETKCAFDAFKSFHYENLPMQYIEIF